MASELNIFDVSTGTPTDSWAHGSAAARAWLSGSLRAEDELDLSAEFDAQATARLGADVFKGLASLNADASGAAHAGVRVQAGMPLDLFEAAGIVARVRLEASASVQARVTAGMSAGELRQLVQDALPQEARPYVQIVLDEIRLGATVWARASFAAMAISELVAAIDLFPRDGSEPGVTAHFNYGFAWGYGAGWGVVTNIGFDLKRMLRRLARQAETDLQTGLRTFRIEEGLAPDDPLGLATEAAEVLLPLVLDALVSWCEHQFDSDEARRQSLSESVVDSLRELIVGAIVPRLLSFAGEKLVANVAKLPANSAREIWGEISSAIAALAGAADDPTTAVGEAAVLLTRISGLVPQDVGVPLRTAMRCAAAVAALATESPNSALRSVLATDKTPADMDLQALGGLVLGEELTDFLVEQQLVPAWIAELFNSVATLTATLVSSQAAGVGGITSAEAIVLLRELLVSLEKVMDEAGLWVQLAEATKLPGMVQALRAQTRVLIELCTSLRDDNPIDARSTREAVSVAILMLIGQPLAKVIVTVADRGLSAVPPALRALADEVDATSVPSALDATWEDLARQVVGSTVGFPVAQLLRHAAGTTAQWRDSRLPAELAMLERFLELDLADDMANHGAAKAVADFKKQFLPILGRHVIDVVVTSYEFILKDSVNVFEDMVAGTVRNIRRSLELSAIVSFRLAEEAVAFAEKGVEELRQREIGLEQEFARYSADFLTELSSLAAHIRGLDSYVGSVLTDWMIQQCMGPASAAQMDRWLRDMLRGIVTVSVNLASGGVLSMLGSVLGTMADVITAQAEALRVTAATEQGSLVGIQPLLEALFSGEQLPAVIIPIAVDIPNPFGPFILPSIHVEITRVPIPAKVLSSMLITTVFASAGVAPLIVSLNATSRSLRLTNEGLATVRSAISGNSAEKMRQALQAARPGQPLTIEIAQPLPAAVAPRVGSIVFRIVGANLSFVDPEGAGLPSEASSRVQLMVNGQLVSLFDVQWSENGNVLEAQLNYGPWDVDGVFALAAGPAAVVVAVTDGYGVTSAQAAWHFVVRNVLDLGFVFVPVVWFPIANGLTAPVPDVHRFRQRLGGGHRLVDRPPPALEAPRIHAVVAQGADADQAAGGLQAGLDGLAEQKIDLPSRRWARARPTVLVEQRVEPLLPSGYLRLDRLRDDAAAWCTLNGQFGLVDFSTRKVTSWATGDDDTVRLIRGAGDAVIIGTSRGLYAFDPETGSRLWACPREGQSPKVLDVTREQIVAIDRGNLMVGPPCEPASWSIKLADRTAVARVMSDRLIIAEHSRTTIRALSDGEVAWRGKSFGEIVASERHILVPGSASTSIVYSLDDAAPAKLTLTSPVDPRTGPRISIVDGPLAPVVAESGDLLLVDLSDALELGRLPRVPRIREAARAWLAGGFVLTSSPPTLWVSHIWGGVATVLPLQLVSGTDSVATGDGDAIVRSSEGTRWLRFG
jgi:hypothetical protein